MTSEYRIVHYRDGGCGLHEVCVEAGRIVLIARDAVVSGIDVGELRRKLREWQRAARVCGELSPEWF